jgi:hypothetical protein
VKEIKGRCKETSNVKITYLTCNIYTVYKRVEGNWIASKQKSKQEVFLTLQDKQQPRTK